MPLIFTVVGRARESENSFQASLARSELRMSRRDRRRNNPTGFWVIYRGQAEPPVSGETVPANPAMGFAGLLSGVSGAFSQHAAALLRRARVVCAVRSSPRPSFRGPPSARGFCARLISGDVHSFDPRRVPRAQGVPGTGTRSCIEVRRRHPCRRRPFSVFGRSAPSRSDRFQAVTSVFEDVLTFRTNFLSEVSHRPV